MTLIGGHIHAKVDELEDIYKIGANIVQIFISTKNELSHYDKFIELLKKLNIKCVVHCAYNINISREFDSYSHQIHEFIETVHIANYIGAIAVVIHTGKQLEIKNAIDNMLLNLKYIHDNTRDMKILIETSSGQGTETLVKLEDLSKFFNKLKKYPRFGICLDTCHVYSAGYDIDSKYLEQFEKLIGIKYICLIHLNDSKKDIDSRVDRHENIGVGKIGYKKLQKYCKFFKKLNVPIILETPDRTKYKTEIQFIKSS